MATDTKLKDALNLALDALISAENWLRAEQAIARTSYKGDATRVATEAHGIFLAAMERVKPLIEKRRNSNG